MSIRMRPSGTSNSSAAICASAVFTPVPSSTLLVKTVTVPSLATAIQESSCVGSGVPGACASPAKRASAGNRLKLTISAPPALSSSRRDSSVFIEVSSDGLSGRALDRAENARVRGAAAEIARERLLDFGVGGLGIRVEQRLGADDEAVDAVAALERLLLDERLLQGMRIFRRAEAFERRDRAAADVLHLQRAGAHRLAVDEDGARAALREAAAELRPVEL